MGGYRNQIVTIPLSRCQTGWKCLKRSWEILGYFSPQVAWQFVCVTWWQYFSSFPSLTLTPSHKSVKIIWYLNCQFRIIFKIKSFIYTKWLKWKEWHMFLRTFKKKTPKYLFLRNEALSIVDRFLPIHEMCNWVRLPENSCWRVSRSWSFSCSGSNLKQ